MHPFEAFGKMGALDCNRGFCITSLFALANLAGLVEGFYLKFTGQKWWPCSTLTHCTSGDAQIHPKLSSWHGKALSPTNGLDFGHGICLQLQV